MWDDEDYNHKPRVTFIFEDFDDEGNPTSRIERRLIGNDTEYLPNLLREFHYFLMGMTYTYVDEIIAKKDFGDVSSTEL